MTTCKQWTGLEAQLLDIDCLDQEGQVEARRHLETCLPCRSRALAVEPSLLLAAIPPIDTSDDDVQRMIEDVRALRRTHSLELSGRNMTPRVRQLAAACILLVALLSTGVPRSWGGSKQSLIAVKSQAPIRTQSAWRASFARSDLLTLNTSGRLEFGSARVYQIRADDLSLMMVVDETLDL